ncbi:cysteine synthase family protein, partial [Chlorobium phaeovibrioides]
MPNHDILDLHSETPMVQLRQLSRNIRPAVMAKLEYMNPAFSHYYRVAAAVVRDAEERRLIHPGMTLVDWTYGNSGIALAMAAVSHGYKVLLVAPDKISREKHDVLRALGAELVITPSEALPGESRSCMNVAGNLVNNIPNAFFAGMYDHPLNLEVHRDVTGSEIAAQTDGKVTHVFVPMSSAAMISGIAAALKSTNSGVKIVGVEPVGSVFSALLNDGRPGETSFSELEEIGAQRQPSFWDPSLIDEVVQVSDGEAMNCARELLRSDAVFAGSAS